MMEPISRIEIRRVRVTDAEAINEIRRQPSVVRFTLAVPEEPLDGTRRFLEGLGPDDHALVVQLDGRVVGMAGLHRRAGKRRHSAELGMMVHDQAQGRGLGRMLLVALLELADELGLTRVELEVMADNNRAIRLYESAGFQTEGRKRNAVVGEAGAVDLLVMSRLR